MAEYSDNKAPTRFPLRKRFVAGALAGIFAAILMIGSLMVYSSSIGAGVWMPLKTLAALVYGVEALVEGPAAIVTGAGIQLVLSVLLGILFGLATSRRTSTILALSAGVVVGVAIWALMELYVLPILDPTMAARIALMPVAYFVSHVLLGIGLGLTPFLVRTLSTGRARETVRVEHPVEILQI